jgi:uncharacterized protein (DUF2267 family)
VIRRKSPSTNPNEKPIMSDSVTSNINSSVQKTYEWIADVESELHSSSRQEAYHALRSVLHALRDRLTVEEAAHLAAQLPGVLRGVYYESWSPANKPDKLGKHEFLDRIKGEYAAAGHADPHRCATAVFAVLRKRISAGEIQDIRSMLPKDIQELWLAS